MRTSTISAIMPIVERPSQIVVAWQFRLTLEESGERVYEDLQAAVPRDDRRVFSGWHRAELWALVNRTAKEHPAVPKLHSILSSRVSTQVRHDLKIESLPE